MEEVKDIFKAGCPIPRVWKLQGLNAFKVSTGYQWLIGGTKVPWDKIIWARASIPHHAFIFWVFVQHRLPTKMRLNRFITQIDLQCSLCNTTAEDDTHIFSNCPNATEVWDSLSHWWPLPFHHQHSTVEDMTTSLSNYKAPRAQKQITYAIFAASIYFIWYARNQRLFKNQWISAAQTVYAIKEQIRH